ncbi:methionine ABC transporter ATP-binding protein [Aureimonas sp. AU4]|uniref:methionine ABC transporter ATP-binding protein n=1 Tax=Aureimonas sp. AU4 TaxID=1638163 RepID=UPI000784B994|nr:ATP-binding cassette domain-containing protein [Aureimonas sp. AU4]
MTQHVFPAALEPAPGTSGSEIVRLASVTRRFGPTLALDDVSLAVAEGEILAIIGRSGAGKSTLIRCLNGLERPDAGHILIEGADIAALAERELQPLRRRVGMIFQHFNLLANRTVRENVALPLKIAGEGRRARDARAAELLELVGLSAKADSYPAQLSGGQKQRVGIARALAARPKILLSDEATSALDPETTQQILELLRRINRELGLTVVLITHEMEVVRTVADRVAVIEAGRIVEEGPVWRVFANPRQALTRSLLATVRPQLPRHIAERLSPVPGRAVVLRADVAGPGAGRLAADAEAALGRPVELLHGGIDHIQGQAVGSLFLEIGARNEGEVERITSVLAARGAEVEVLGHV